MTLPRSSRGSVETRRRPILAACDARPLACIILMLGVWGCSGNSDIERGTQRFFGDVGHGVLGHRSSHEEMVFPVTGVVNIEVRNFAGDVVIRGDRLERVTDAQVLFDRRAVHGGSREEEGDASLPEIEWDARLVPAATPGEPPTLRIESSTDHDEPWFQRLEIEIVVAQLGRVDVSTTRGKVQVWNNRGPVDITTSKGDVRVITAWPQTGESVIVTRDGDIDYRVRGESAFIIDAESVGGLVKTRCEAGRLSATDARNDHDSFHAVVNGGRERLILRTVDGNIRVAVVADPHGVGSFHVAP